MSDKPIELKIPEGITGVALKELMYRFVSYLATFNEYRDRADYKRSSQKTVVEHVRDLATIDINSDPDMKNFTSPVKTSYIDDRPVQHPILKTETTYMKEKQLLTDLEFKLSRANSRVRELELLVQVCRSGLSYDKNEMGAQ